MKTARKTFAADVLPKFWREHFLAWELIVGVAIAAGGVGLVLWRNWSAVIDVALKDNRGTIYGALASIFGALLGFVITSISIVLGFSNDSRFERVRKTTSYLQLWTIFTSSVRWLGAASASALVALLIDRDNHTVRWAEFLCALTTIIATLRLIRAIWAIEQLIDVAVNQDPLRNSSTT